jgi:glutamate---methylamine ligase
MVRVPDPGRFELRLADGATNPYLAPAAYLAAGLDGIARGIEPPKRLDVDMYADGHKVRNAPRLPANLLDALRAFEKDKVLQAALGAPFSKAYGKLRQREWQTYTGQLTDWERAYTLDV